MKSFANEFIQNMVEGAKQHQTQHAADYELIANGIKNETDLTEQGNLVEQMVSQRRFGGKGTNQAASTSATAKSCKATATKPLHTTSTFS